MPAPGTDHPNTVNTGSLDIAYILFLIAGVMIVLGFSLIAADPKAAVLVGFWMVPLFPVMLVGIVMGLCHWRHRPLFWLALLSALVAIVAVITDKPGYDTNITLIAWGAAMVILPVWWLARGRRRYKEKLSLPEQAASLGTPSTSDRDAGG
jgi:hypothetical protein